MNDAKDLLQRLGRVGARIAPELTDRDVERLVDGGLRRRRRKTLARGTITAALVGCLAGLLVVMRPPRSSEPTAPVAAPTPSSAPAIPSLHLSDGSVATPLETTTVLHLLHDAPGPGRPGSRPRAKPVRGRLEAGAALFDSRGRGHRFGRRHHLHGRACGQPRRCSGRAGNGRRGLGDGPGRSFGRAQRMVSAACDPILCAYAGGRPPSAAKAPHADEHRHARRTERPGNGRRALSGGRPCSGRGSGRRRSRALAAASARSIAAIPVRPSRPSPSAGCCS